MHPQVVERQKWLGEEEFIRTLNFCHILPGPEALQLAIFIGYKRGGYLGGSLAGILFILPGCALGAPWLGAIAATFWLFVPSFAFVLGTARHIDWLTSRPGVKEFLKGVTFHDPFRGSDGASTREPSGSLSSRATTSPSSWRRSRSCPTERSKPMGVIGDGVDRVWRFFATAIDAEHRAARDSPRTK